MSTLPLSTFVLGLAWFVAINAAGSVCARGIGAMLLASRHRGRTALLLSVRLFPAAASLVFVAAVFLPAHWRLEPGDSQESFGPLLYMMAAAGVLILLRSAARAAAVAGAGRRLRTCERMARVDAVVPAGDIYEVPGFSGVSLAGVLRTRILIGPAVLRQLSPSEIDVAVAHELAHRGAFDNLKRFAIVCAPDLFGFSSVARRLEDGWRAQAESLADARAVNGNGRRALDLASALVKVARLGVDARSPLTSPAWSTLHDSPLLEMRVRRLLTGVPPAADRPLRSRPIAFAAVLVVGLAVTGTALAGAVHQLTESIVRFLS
jgi:hypothetical protein